MFPHAKRERLTHGGSPGNGVTPTHLSGEPLATEGEATPGPDDWNPYEEEEARMELAARADTDPTSDPDPFVFDDVGDTIRQLELPSDLPDGPRF